MIVGQRKSISSILELLKGHHKVLVAGCGTCMTVCLSGGEKEVGILATAIRLASKKNGNNLQTLEATPFRQCEKEMVGELAPQISEVDAVLSLGCGAGVQMIAQIFPDTAVYPAVDTSFIGIPEEMGIWAERCASCGECILDKTAGICPIARCSKSILNGPCGGSQDGKCEVNPETECAWQLIYDRLKKFGKDHLLDDILLPKNWSRNRDGGPRKIVRGDLIL